MPPYINNEAWFHAQSKEFQEYIFEQFKDDFQAFLKWSKEPYKNNFKDIELWPKQN